MDEYTDVKQRKHKVIQTVRKPERSHGTEESREAAEQEIVEALFRIFEPAGTVHKANSIPHA